MTQKYLDYKGVQTLVDNIKDKSIPLSQKGAVNGIASLDNSGKVPTSQLPSYVNDVLEFNNYSSFPIEGEKGKLYIDISTTPSSVYRWTGTTYLQITGIIGAQGETGAQGYRGYQGYQGYQGKSGVDGLQGIQGTTGLQGTKGIQGTQGETGAQGYQGYQGKSGVDGLQGIQGTTGLQGTKGTQGYQGYQGLQGTNGSNGIKGPQGVQGYQGLQGPKGATGPQGPAGTVPSGTYWSLAIANPETNVHPGAGTPEEYSLLLRPTANGTIYSWVVQTYQDIAYLNRCRNIYVDLTNYSDSTITDLFGPTNNYPTGVRYHIFLMNAKKSIKVYHNPNRLFASNLAQPDGRLNYFALTSTLPDAKIEFIVLNKRGDSVWVDVEDMKYYNSSYSTDTNSACPPNVTGGATSSNIDAVNTFLKANSKNLLTTQDDKGYTFNLIDMLGLLIQKTEVK